MNMIVSKMPVSARNVSKTVSASYPTNISKPRRYSLHTIESIMNQDFKNNISPQEKIRIMSNIDACYAPYPRTERYLMKNDNKREPGHVRRQENHNNVYNRRPENSMTRFPINRPPEQRFKPNLPIINREKVQNSCEHKVCKKNNPCFVEKNYKPHSVNMQVNQLNNIANAKIPVNQFTPNKHYNMPQIKLTNHPQQPVGIGTSVIRAANVKEGNTFPSNELQYRLVDPEEFNNHSSVVNKKPAATMQDSNAFVLNNIQYNSESPQKTKNNSSDINKKPTANIQEKHAFTLNNIQQNLVNPKEFKSYSSIINKKQTENTQERNDFVLNKIQPNLVSSKELKNHSPAVNKKQTSNMQEKHDFVLNKIRHNLASSEEFKNNSAVNKKQTTNTQEKNAFVSNNIRHHSVGSEQFQNHPYAVKQASNMQTSFTYPSNILRHNSVGAVEYKNHSALNKMENVPQLVGKHTLPLKPVPTRRVSLPEPIRQYQNVRDRYQMVHHRKEISQNDEVPFKKRKLSSTESTLLNYPTINLVPEAIPNRNIPQYASVIKVVKNPNDIANQHITRPVQVINQTPQMPIVNYDCKIPEESQIFLDTSRFQSSQTLDIEQYVKEVKNLQSKVPPEFFGFYLFVSRKQIFYNQKPLSFKTFLELHNSGKLAQYHASYLVYIEKHKAHPISKQPYNHVSLNN